MYKEFISNICRVLKISVPAISHDTSDFTSDTMMAQVNLTGDTIYIKDLSEPNPDLFFAIAHELRHIWQLNYKREIYFTCYKTTNSCSSLKEYNLQPAELDANAFAGLAIIYFLNLQPLFEGMDEDLKNKIFERMEYLITNGLSG